MSVHAPPYRLSFAAALILAAQFATVASAAPTVVWTRQLDSGNNDEVWKIAADGHGGAVAVGTTQGDLFGPLANGGGGTDTFIAHYDSAGNLAWGIQNGRVRPRDVVCCGGDSIYVTGDSLGDSSGGSDIFLEKYDQAGELLWSRDFGTPSLTHVNDHEFPTGVAVDRAGNVVVTGSTWGDFVEVRAEKDSDVFLRKFDDVGNVLWTQFLGARGDMMHEVPQDISIDGFGNSLVLFGSGSFTPEPGAHLAKFDSEGALLWNERIAEGALGGQRFDVDNSGNAFVAIGSVGLTKYDPDGNPIWTQSLPSSDVLGGVGDVAVDAEGNVLVVGMGAGDSTSQAVPYLGKYDTAGNMLWTHLFPSQFYGRMAVSPDEFGNIFVGSSHSDTWVSLLRESPLGDTNADGVVDLEDLNNVRNHFGETGGLGDTNGDGIIDLADLNAVRNNFGAGGSMAVPEPGSVLLATIGIISLCLLPSGSAKCRRTRADRLPRLRRHFSVSSKRIAFSFMTFFCTAGGATAAQLFDLGGNIPEFVAEDGSAVAGFNFTRPGGQNSLNATRWTPATGVVDLGDIPGTPADQPHFERAFGGSSDASVIVGIGGTHESRQAYRWTAETGMVGLGALGSEPHLEYASATNSDGSVIYGLSYGQGFRWTAATGMTTTIPFIGRDFVAVDSTDDGSMLVGGDSVVFSYSGYWTADEGFVELTLPDYWLEVDRVSRDGGAISGIAWKGDPSDRQGFRWTREGGVELLDRATGVRGFEPTAMTREGNVIVGTGIMPDTTTSPYVWSDTRGMQSFRSVLVQDHGLGALLNGWSITRVSGMDESGRVFAGDAERNGQYHGFVLQLDRPIIAAPIAGDTNADGVVDLEDLNNVRNNFGGSGLGDTNSDGLVDLKDLNNVRNHFGQATGATAVPEPAALALALIGAAAALCCTRRANPTP